MKLVKLMRAYHSLQIFLPVSLVKHCVCKMSWGISQICIYNLQTFLTFIQLCTMKQLSRKHAKTHVFALWDDGFYYPATILSTKTGLQNCKYYDGIVSTVHEDNTICFKELSPGMEVLTLLRGVESKFFLCSLIITCRVE